MNGIGWLLVWGAALYHLVVGLLSMTSLGATRRLGHLLYGLAIPAQGEPRFAYVLKPLGAYAVCIGLACVYAMCRNDPILHDSVRLLLALLFALRALLRCAYYRLCKEAFGVSWSRNLLHVALNTLLVWLLLCASGGYGTL